MDIQTVLDNAVQASRHESLKTSPQLTLGELILKLEPLKQTWTSYDGKETNDKTVRFDFASCFPTCLSSWRGSYSELALEWDGSGYDPKANKDSSPMGLKDFLQMLKDAIGKEYTGWKGGEYTMGKNTPLWVSNAGNSDHTGILDIKDDTYEVVLITGECQY